MGHHLEGFRPAPKGEEKANVIMNISSMGILKVTAVSITSGRRKHITIDDDRMRMDEETILRVQREVKSWLSILKLIWNFNHHIDCQGFF